MEKIPNGSEKWLWTGRGLQLKIEIGLYNFLNLYITEFEIADYKICQTFPNLSDFREHG